MATPNWKESASRYRNSASLQLRSAFASRVSRPCLNCGWLVPRPIAFADRAPWYRQTFIPKAAGLRQRSPRALHFAEHRCVFPEVMFGSGIGKGSLHSSSPDAGWWAFSRILR